MTLGNMHRRLAATVLSCLALCWTTASNGMEFTKSVSRNGTAIKATGPIEIGMPTSFRD